MPLYILQRSNHCQACLFADQNYRCHLDWLAGMAARRASLAIRPAPGPKVQWALTEIETLRGEVSSLAVGAAPLG